MTNRQEESVYNIIYSGLSVLGRTEFLLNTFCSQDMEFVGVQVPHVCSKMSEKPERRGRFGCKKKKCSVRCVVIIQLQKRWRWPKMSSLSAASWDCCCRTTQLTNLFEHLSHFTVFQHHRDAENTVIQVIRGFHISQKKKTSQKHFPTPHAPSNTSFPLKNTSL